MATKVKAAQPPPIHSNADDGPITAPAITELTKDAHSIALAESDTMRQLVENRLKERAMIREMRLAYGIGDELPTVETIAAEVFPILLENFLKFGGRCTPNGYSDVTPESVVIITNQAALIAEQHVAAMAKWRERQKEPKKNPDEGQARFA